MARNGAFRTLALLCTLSIALSGGLLADGPASVHGAASASCEDPVKGRKFNDELLQTVIAIVGGFNPETFNCSFKAENKNSANQNNGQKGIKGTGTVRVLNAFGNTISTLNWPIKTGKDGYDPFSLDPDDYPGLAGVSVDVNLTGSKKLNRANVYCAAGNAPPCEGDATTLCLNDNRFKVDVDWSTSAQGFGEGMVLNSQNNEGSFYFINPANRDLLVQLLSQCSNNDHFWVFASATTSVDFDLTVTDTFTGEVRSYGNQLGGMAAAITDTSAFATCP